MPGDTIGVQVHGWTEVRSGLGIFRGRLPKTVRDAAKDSAQLVVKDAKARVPLGPPAGGHARSSIRVAATRTGSEVRGGGVRYPYYGWLEFGGGVGRRHRTFRQRVSGGRYIFPAVKAKRALMERAMSRNLERAARESGLRTRGGP